MIYSKILYATDLGPQSLYIAEQALALSQLCKASLFVLHVIEPPLLGGADFSQREKAIAQKQQLAQKSLQDLCARLQVPLNHQLITVGEGQADILQVAKEQQCDLIVVGSHGVGGYLHALGSTAHHIITHAHCNVLIVQVSYLKEVIEKTVQNTQEYSWETTKKMGEELKVKGPSFGSLKGFGDEIKRGPRLSPRPPGSPYRGGTREPENDSEPEDNH